MIEEKVHSRFGGSSCEIWSNCPASVGLSEGMPNPTSRAAAAGTVAHWLAEKALLEDMDAASIQNWEGEIREVGEHRIRITEDMTEWVWLYKKTIDEDTKKYKIDPGCRGVEVKFRASSIHADAFGTCDAHIIVPLHKLIVYDLKTGSGKAVPAKENKQLIFYVLGLLDTLGNLGIEEAELVIVQPSKALNKKIVRRWTLSIEKMEEYRKIFSRAAKNADSENPEVKAGPWCKFCRAKTKCGAKTSSALAVISSPQQSPQPFGVGGDVAALSIEQLEHVYMKKEEVDAFFESVYHRLHQEATRHRNNLKYFKLVDKMDKSKWADEKKAAQYLEQVLGEDAYRRKLITITQARKALLNEGLNAHNCLKPYISKKVSGTKLVPIDHAKEESKESITTSFSEIIDIDNL